MLTWKDNLKSHDFSFLSYVSELENPPWCSGEAEGALPGRHQITVFS